MSQTEVMSAIRQIAAERKIDIEEIVSAIKEAIKSIYINENNIESKEKINVNFDPNLGDISVFVEKDIVKEVKDKITEITLEEAKKIDKNASLGGTIVVEITAEGDFGRIAAQSARQVIMQKFRESEKEAVIRQFQDKVGEIISVYVQRVTQEGDIICEVGKARAVMPKNERVPSEYYRLGSSVKVLLKNIEEDERGKFMLISRSDPKFLEELFRLEVPEIDSGTVKIVSIAREAGSRSKVAVKSVSSGVDAIGSCVGQKGVRINAISNELKMGDHEEKIDIILWDPDIEIFLKNSIRPADCLKVIVDEKLHETTLIVPEEQYSLALGTV